MAMTPDLLVTVLGKPGCHLCEQAAIDVAAVCEPRGVAWQEVSILGDPALVDRYAEEIPVVLINGAQHTFLRVDRQRLDDALTTYLGE